MLTASRSGPPTLVATRIALICGVVACSNDAQCLLLPCPISIAAEINVGASNAPMGIAGLSLAVTGEVTGNIPCGQPSGPTTTCLLDGGAGTYHVTISAPAYQSRTLDFSVNGTPAGCSRCGEVDTKQFSVVLQPAIGRPVSRS